MNKKILAIIPARGGSKRLPGKNILEFAGKPLIAWTIEAAKKSKYVDCCVVSSDSEEIIQCSKKWGIDETIKRSKQLSTDKASSVDVVLDVIKKYPQYEILLLLQPTSPLRTEKEIDEALKLFLERKTDSLASFTKVELKSNLYYSINKETIKGLFSKKIKNIFKLNGVIYIVEKKFILKEKKFIHKKTTPYLMPPNLSVDIDTKEDFILAEHIFKNENNFKT